LTSPPGGVQSTAISVSVCLSVRPSVRSHILKTIRPNFTKFSVGLHVTSGRGSVFFWGQCNMLCTSGFVDDGHVFPQWGQWCRINQKTLCLVQLARWRHQSAAVQQGTAAKSATLDCSVILDFWFGCTSSISSRTYPVSLIGATARSISVSTAYKVATIKPSSYHSNIVLTFLLPCAQLETRLFNNDKIDSFINDKPHSRSHRPR